jgi:hypothetical protein
MTRSRLRSWFWLLAMVLAVPFAGGCGTVESKRIEQLLNHKGWGGRVHGDAQVENYVAFGDIIQFYLPPNLLLEAGTEPLAVLANGQQVSIDGTIFIPFVGALPVLGLTERELSSLVSEQVQAIYNLPIQVQARIVNNLKHYFVVGEWGASKARVLLPGDWTVLEAFFTIPHSQLANIGRLHLIRPDPKNPLVISINIREMIVTGNTTWNLAVKEFDILYLPPTFFGAIARFLERLLIPAQMVLNALFQGLYLRTTYDAIVNDQPFYGGGYFF